MADRQVCDANIGVSVVHPTSIDEYEADYVVVAIKNKKIADEIISDLKEIGINKTILWKEPKSLFEYYKI